jgi:hypothetical protein
VSLLKEISRRFKNDRFRGQNLPRAFWGNLSFSSLIDSYSYESIKAKMAAQVDESIHVRNYLLFSNLKEEADIKRHESRFGVEEYEKELAERIEKIRERQQNNDLKISNLNFNSLNSKKEIVRHALIITCEKLRCQTAAIFLISPKSGRLERIDIQGINLEKSPVESDWFNEETYDVGESFTGLAVKRTLDSRYGETKISRDFDDNNLKYRIEYQKEFGDLKSAIAVPLNGQSRSYGVIRIINKLENDNSISESNFSESDLAWISFLAGVTSAGISKIYQDTRSNTLRYLRNSLVNSNFENFDYSGFYSEILGFLVSSEFAFKAAILHVLKSEEMKLKCFCISDGVSEREDSNPRRLDHEGFVGFAVKSGELQIVEGIIDGELANSFVNSKWVKDNEFDSFGCFPFLIHGKDGVTITLSLFAGYKYEFHPSSIEFLNDVVSSIALLVQKEKQMGYVISDKSLAPSLDLEPQVSSKIKKLQESYVFLDHSGIENYLSKEGMLLIVVLENVYNKVREYFKFNKIFLELFDDLDLSDSPNLIIRISTSDDVDSILECQKNFNEGYWLNSISANNIKNIIINFNFE